MKKRAHKNGFTLMEVIIVLAVISILAAMLVPIAVRNIDDARLTAAAKDTQSIATAIVNFHIDVRPYWPAYSTQANFTNKHPDVYILETKDGNVPKGPLNSDPTPAPGDDIGFLVSSYNQ